MSLGYLARLGLVGDPAQTADVAPAINALEHFLASAEYTRQFPAEVMAQYQQAWSVLSAYTQCGCGQFPPTSGANKKESMKRVAELVQNARALASQPQPVPGNPGVLDVTSSPSVSSGQAATVAVSPDAPADSTFLKQPGAGIASGIPGWVWVVVAVGVGAWVLQSDEAAA